MAFYIIAIEAFRLLKGREPSDNEMLPAIGIVMAGFLAFCLLLGAVLFPA